MKKVLMIVAALAAILVLSLSAAAVNYVRWNNQLDECVYFYAKGTGERAQCFVAEANCDSKISTKNEEKTVDPVGCYTVPRNQIVQSTGVCAKFVEGDLIKLNYKGNDPDKDIGPAGKLIYAFEPPFDNGGTWQTKDGDAGDYKTKVTVTDGEFTEAAEVCFTVKSGNKPPVLSLNDIVANEGDTITLKPECKDPNGDAVKIAYSGDMTGPTWKTGYDDAGIYTVVVTCTDTKGASADKKVTVTVNDVNRKPVISGGVSDVTVYETETVRLNPVCADPEGQGTTVTYSGRMTSSTWQTGYDDAGEYAVTVTCADASGMKTSDNVKVTVLDKNRPPSITAMVVAG